LLTKREVFSEFVSLPFDGCRAEISGQICALLAATGTPIGPYDLQVAAIAIANSLTLVTRNTNEFSRVEGLHLDDLEVVT